MATHNLKTWPEFFRVVASGQKPFEIRQNNRDFQVGDTLVLQEYDLVDGYTGKVVRAEVTYITDWQQKEGYVVMGIRRE